MKSLVLGRRGIFLLLLKKLNEFKMALDEDEVIITAEDLDGTFASWLHFFCEVRSKLGRRSYTGMGLGRNLVAQTGSTAEVLHL